MRWSSELQGGNLKGPPTKKETVRYCEKYYELWSDRKRWVLRDQLTIVKVNRDTERFIYHFDIDFKAVLEIGENDSKDGKVKPSVDKESSPLEDPWLPLESIKKGESLSTELVGQYKDTGCIVTRRENTRIALYILIGYLKSNHFNIELLEQNELNQLYEMLLFSGPDGPNRQSPQVETNDLYKALMRINSIEVLKRDTLEADFDANDLQHEDEISKYTSIKKCLHEPGFRKLVNHFVTHYPLTVSLPPNVNLFRTNLDVKVSDVQKLNFIARLGRVIKTGLFVPNVRIPISSLSFNNMDSSFKFVAPDESRIIAAHLLLKNRIIPTSDRHLIRTKKSSNQVSFHFPSPNEINYEADGENFLKSNYEAIVYVNSRRGYFAFPAFFISLFCFLFSSSILFFISNLLHSQSNQLDTKDLANVGGLIVALIAVIPSVSIVLLLLRDEHEMNSISLGIPRLILVINLISLIFFSLSIIGGAYLCTSKKAKECLTEMDFSLFSISLDMFFAPISLLNYQAFCLTYFFGTIISSSIYANIRTVKSRRIILVTSIVTFGLFLLTITTFIHPYNYKTASLTFLLLTLFLLIFVCVYSWRGSRSHLLDSP